jgi:glycosyl transferase family 25
MKKKIKIFVLTLVDEKERINHIIKQMKKFHLKFEIFYGKRGKHLSKKDISNYSESKAFKIEKRALSLDEIACALSHISIYKKIKQLKCQYSLVLEDDIILKNDFVNVLDKINNFPKDWELINFRTDARQKIINFKFYKNYKFTRFLQNANRSCALLLKISAIKKLLRHAYPIRQPLDELTGKTNITRIKSYGIKPNLVKLKDFPSTILYRNTFYGKYYLSSWVLRTPFINILNQIVNVIKKFFKK